MEISALLVLMVRLVDKMSCHCVVLQWSSPFLDKLLKMLNYQAAHWVASQNFVKEGLDSWVKSAMVIL